MKKIFLGQRWKTDWQEFMSRINQTIRRLKKNSTISNGIWVYVLQGCNTFAPFITLPYATRVLSINQYGVFSFFLSLITYLQVVIDYGFDMSATRKAAVSINEIKKVEKLYTTVFLAKFLLFLSTVGISLIYTFIFIDSQADCIAFWVLGIGLIGSFLRQDWLFQAFQKVKALSIINVLLRIISILLIITIVKSESDFYIFCFLYFVTLVLSGLLSLRLVRSQFDVHFVKVSFTNVKAEFKNGWYVFTTSLSSKVFSSIGVTLLGVFATNEITGKFAAIQKIPNLLLLFWVPLSQVIYPIISKRMATSMRDGINFALKLRKIILPFFILIALFVSVFSKPIVTTLFGLEYADFHLLCIPLSIWLVFAINNNFLGIQILLSSNHDKEYSQSFQISVIATIALNLILTYLFKEVGAAFAPLISEIILGILLSKKVKKVISEEKK